MDTYSPAPTGTPPAPYSSRKVVDEVDVSDDLGLGNASRKRPKQSSVAEATATAGSVPAEAEKQAKPDGDDDEKPTEGMLTRQCSPCLA